LDDAAIPRGLDRVASLDSTAEGTAVTGGRPRGLERARWVIEGDFVAVIGTAFLQNGDPERGARIHQIPDAGEPAPGSGCTVRREPGHQSVVARLMVGQPGPKDARITVARQPWMDGKEESPSESEQEQGTQCAEARGIAGTDDSLEAGGDEREPDQDVYGPDGKSR
jgi:hypothetical protein